MLTALGNRTGPQKSVSFRQMIVPVQDPRHSMARPRENFLPVIIVLGWFSRLHHHAQQRL